MKRRNVFQLFLAWLASATVPMSAAAANFPLKKTKAEWRKLVSPSAYEVLFEHGTERPGSSPLNAEKRPGTFVCVACNLPLFSAAHKYESGTGWPSFNDPLPGSVGTTVDRSWGMTRTEVHCSQCGGHLGHVFPDGPPPTGLRYCINGVAMTFEPEA
jgi:peptide-methionine (R)-S-oxide reductase